MTITQEKIDNLRSKVRVNLKKEDYEPVVKKEIKTLAKKMKIDGFRPGMVPLEVVKKKYGNSVMHDEINNMIMDLMENFLKENKIDTLVPVMPSKGQTLDLDINALNDISFSFDVSHAPEINLDYIEKSPSFTKYKVIMDEKIVDNEMMRIRKRFPAYEYPETMNETDVLTFTVEELDNDGNPKPGGINTVTSLAPDMLKDDARNKILPLKKQESIEYNVFELTDHDRESIAKHILNMNDLSNLAEVGTRFKLTLDNIKRAVPAELNPEFFQKIYGSEGPKTEEEMRRNIQDDLDAYFDGQTDKVLVNEIYKGLLANMDFPLPDDFIKRYVAKSGEKKLSEAEIEEEYPAFAKILRWSLVRKKIIAAQNIQVSDDEIRDRITRNVIQQLYGHGLQGIGQQYVEQFVLKQLADKRAVEDTEEQIQIDKVLDYVKSKANLTVKEVSYDEYKAMAEQE